MPIRPADVTYLAGPLVALALLASAPARAQESHIGNLTGEARRGKALYSRYCFGCHGVRGDGQGENAPYLRPEFPKPRDFTAGLFKCRSTPSGSIPLDSDLFETVGRGINTTAMPPWFPLTSQQRADLVAYVKGFSPRFREEQPDPPVTIPPETPFAGKYRAGQGAVSNHASVRAMSWPQRPGRRPFRAHAARQ